MGVDIELVREVSSLNSDLPIAARVLSRIQAARPNQVTQIINIKNSDNANLLYLLGGPHVFFRRMRILCNGTIVEDIDQYNRVHEMLSILSGKHNRDMDDVSSVCKRWDSDEVYYAVSNNLLDANLNSEDPTFTIAGDLGATVSYTHLTLPTNREV